MTFGLSDEYKWPKKEDRLLRAEDDWNKAVTFAEQAVSRHVHIWEGYMSAGAALVEQCQRTNSRLDRTELVYPILFCYRHGLELAMKWIIDRYGRYARTIPPDDYAHHDLWKLWHICKRVIIEVGSEGETEAMLAVEQVVKDYHDLDRGSFSFRYSTDRNGATIRLPSAPFDLQNIKDVMEAVNNLFTGADGQLDDNSTAAG